MKTVVFCAVLVCFVATVGSTVCGGEERETLLTTLINDNVDAIFNPGMGYAWSGPGCCGRHNVEGKSKAECVAMCLAQDGSETTGDRRKPCTRITYYNKGALEGGSDNWICRIHNGCLNANNEASPGIRGKRYEGLAASGPATALGDKFYAVHRNCMINPAAAGCPLFSGNSNNPQSPQCNPATGNGADTTLDPREAGK